MTRVGWEVRLAKGVGGGGRGLRPWDPGGPRNGGCEDGEMTRRRDGARGIGVPCDADAVNASASMPPCRVEGRIKRLGYGIAFILIYVTWVVSAYVTFSEGSWHRRRRRRHRCAVRPSMGRNASPTFSQRRGGGTKFYVIIAPPIIGRRRHIRRAQWTGKRRILRFVAVATRVRRSGGPLLRPSHWRRCGHQARMRPRPGAAGEDGRELRPIRRRSMAEACKGAMGTLCVGQASNPGPQGILQWVSTTAASVLRYPSPTKVGFHGSHTAGHFQADRPPVEPFVLRMVTANTTGWRPLQAFMRSTDANVIFAQEHRLLPEAVPAASAWARKHGWKSVWAPAKRGSGGGASAGTVILVRAFMGLRHPDKGGAVVTDAHAVAAVIEPPSCRPFMGYSAYFHHAQGLSRPNLALTASMGAHWEAQGDDSLQLVIAADFNMKPDVFARSGIASRVWGRTVAPLGGRGTCRTRSNGKVYDYFYMSAAMADVVDDVSPIEGTGVRTHTPVEARFHPRLTALKALSLRAPPSLPLEEVYGPRPPPPPWAKLQEVAEDLVAYARDGGPYDNVDEMLTKVYAAWMDMAEDELAGITGADLPKRGRRAEGPYFRWKSILPEVDRSPPPSGAAAAAWLADIARDATRVPKEKKDEEDVNGLDLVQLLRRSLEEDVQGKDMLRDKGLMDVMTMILDDASGLIMQGEERQGERWTDWLARLETLLSELNRIHASAAAAESAERVRAWKD